MRLYMILPVVFFLFLAGCGGEKLPEGMPKLTPVVLTFQQAGAPLDGAIVSLIPLDSANSQWYAGGTTDAGGKLKAKTLAKYNGVVPGKYKITVIKTVLEPLPSGMTMAERMKYKPKPPVEYAHKKYADKKSTPLDLEVAGALLEQSFEVEKP
ncbi:MAG: hypothetical protein FWC50_02010 [Planctomycetaceae bacterium]|nr:hypothetical protein [Planctomycetaceae bacterium]